MKKVIFAILLLVGCQGINPVGPIIQLGIMWYQGEASKYYNTDQATTAIALKKVLKDLDLDVTSEKIEGKTIHLYVKQKGEDKFHCKVISVKTNTTKVFIRVNVMGDKAYAELIYRHLDSQTGIKTYNSLKKLNQDAAD